MSMNCHGIGRFAQDPELIHVGNAKKAVFSLAVDEFRKVNGERKKVTQFFDFEAWDTAAELICQYKVKGDQLYFQAIARKDTWEKDGVKKSKVFFRLTEFQFISNGKFNQPTADAPVEPPKSDDIPY
jgi:single-stranded DNA-binding protein